MLRAATVSNFKSFEDATLFLAPLTLLIGANASGKSNAIEALQLLSWLASGRRLGDVLFSIREQELSIRGNLTDFTYRNRDITLGCLVDMEEGPLLILSITLGIREGGLRIVGESLRGDEPASLQLRLRTRSLENRRIRIWRSASRATARPGSGRRAPWRRRGRGRRETG